MSATLAATADRSQGGLMRKLSVKRLVILALISAVIFTVIAFSVDTRAGWAMCLVLVAIFCVAWVGVFAKALIRSVLGRISRK